MVIRYETDNPRVLEVIPRTGSFYKERYDFGFGNESRNYVVKTRNKSLLVPTHYQSSGS